jgi:hypothetical protein
MPFTEITWHDVPLFNSETNIGGWEGMHDLEVQFAALGYHDRTVKALMYGAKTGNPIRLRWDTEIGRHRIERRTVYAIVEYVVRPHGRNSDRVRVHYSGFSHDVYMNQIRFAEVPQAEVEYLDNPRA